MEDREQRALYNSINGRLATSLLLYLAEARAGVAEDDESDRQRLGWLRGILVQSLGGARLLSSEQLAPGIVETYGSPSEEIGFYEDLQRFSSSQTTSGYAAWVEGKVNALEALQRDGWSALGEEQQTTVTELEPLLGWLADGGERAIREVEHSAGLAYG